MRRVAGLAFSFVLSCVLMLGAWQSFAQLTSTGAGKKASPGACSQYTAFAARATGMDASHQSAFQTYICNLVSQGVWAKLDASYVLATDTSAHALLSLVSATYNATANGSPSFTADRGFTGVDSSATVFIDTAFNPSTASGLYALNNKHLSIWSNTNTTSTAGGGVSIGGYETGLTTECAGATACLDAVYPSYNSTGSQYYMDAVFANPANANSTGHYLSNKVGANLVTGYKNATSVATNSAATNSRLMNVKLAILALGSNGGIALAGGAFQIMTATIGQGLTAGDITNLCHEQNTYLNTIAGVSSGIC